MLSVVDQLLWNFGCQHMWHFSKCPSNTMHSKFANMFSQITNVLAQIGRFVLQMAQPLLQVANNSLQPKPFYVISTTLKPHTMQPLIPHTTMQHTLHSHIVTFSSNELLNFWATLLSHSNNEPSDLEPINLQIMKCVSPSLRLSSPFAYLTHFTRQGQIFGVCGYVWCLCMGYQSTGVSKVVPLQFRFFRICLWLLVSWSSAWWHCLIMFVFRDGVLTILDGVLGFHILDGVPKLCFNMLEVTWPSYTSFCLAELVQTYSVPVSRALLGTNNLATLIADVVCHPEVAWNDPSPGMNNNDNELCARQHMMAELNMQFCTMIAHSSARPGAIYILPTVRQQKVTRNHSMYDMNHHTSTSL